MVIWTQKGLIWVTHGPITFDNTCSMWQKWLQVQSKCIISPQLQGYCKTPQAQYTLSPCKCTASLPQVMEALTISSPTSLSHIKKSCCLALKRVSFSPTYKACKESTTVFIILSVERCWKLFFQWWQTWWTLHHCWGTKHCQSPYLQSSHPCKPQSVLSSLKQQVSNFSFYKHKSHHHHGSYKASKSYFSSEDSHNQWKGSVATYNISTSSISQEKSKSTSRNNSKLKNENSDIIYQIRFNPLGKYVTVNFHKIQQLHADRHYKMENLRTNVIKLLDSFKEKKRRIRYREFGCMT